MKVGKWDVTVLGEGSYQGRYGPKLVTVVRGPSGAYSMSRNGELVLSRATAAEVEARLLVCKAPSLGKVGRVTRWAS